MNPLAQDQLKCLTKCLPQSAEKNERSNGHWKLHNRCSKIDFVPKYTISDAKERKQQTNIQHLIMNFNLGHKFAFYHFSTSKGGMRVLKLIL